MSSKKPFISIIIPTLNEESYIQTILNDIVHSVLPPQSYEIIVADSGSTDRTKAMVEEIHKNYPHIHIYFVRANKKGVGLARNTGAQAASGIYLAFLDADTRIAKDFLAVNLQEMQRRKLDVGACYMRPNSRNWLDHLLFFLMNNLGLRLLQYSARPMAFGAGIFAKKDMHDKVAGFNEKLSFGEDIEYVTIAKKLGRFRMLNAKPVLFSMRRAQKEGRWLLVAKALHGLIYHLTHKNMKDMTMSYEYGRFKKTK